MNKVPKSCYWELAQFLMDYYSGAASRGYRLLCKLQPGGNWSEELAQELRNTEMYAYLEANYADRV